MTLPLHALHDGSRGVTIQLAKVLEVEPVAIRLTVPGLGEVVCDTAEDFLELKRAVEGEKRMSAPKASAPMAAPQEGPSQRLMLNYPVSRDGFDEALTMLKTIKSAMPRPATSDQLVRALNVNHPKGLGSVLARIKDAIKNVGSDPDKVFWQQRTALGREYRAGEDFAVTLSRLEDRQSL